MRFKNLIAVGIAALAGALAVKLIQKRENELTAEWREVANDEAEQPCDKKCNNMQEPCAADETREPIDPTTIADAEDFKNWDELGCQG